ncbi:hypothetical protein ACHAQA_009853 [Verticillium albo-atrum]
MSEGNCTPYREEIHKSNPTTPAAARTDPLNPPGTPAPQTDWEALFPVSPNQPNQTPIPTTAAPSNKPTPEPENKKFRIDDDAPIHPDITLGGICIDSLEGKWSDQHISWALQSWEDKAYLVSMRDGMERNAWLSSWEIAAGLKALAGPRSGQPLCWVPDSGTLWTGGYENTIPMSQEMTDALKKARFMATSVNTGGNHWILLIVDQWTWWSFAADSHWGGAAEKEIIQAMTNLEEFYKFNGASDALIRALRSRFSILQSPQQRDGYSCGFYTLDLARSVFLEGQLDVTRSAMYSNDDLHNEGDYNNYLRRHWMTWIDKQFGLSRTNSLIHRTGPDLTEADITDDEAALWGIRKADRPASPDQEEFEDMNKSVVLFKKKPGQYIPQKPLGSPEEFADFLESMGLGDADTDDIGKAGAPTATDAALKPGRTLRPRPGLHDSSDQATPAKALKRARIITPAGSTTTEKPPAKRPGSSHGSTLPVPFEASPQVTPSRKPKPALPPATKVSPPLPIPTRKSSIRPTRGGKEKTPSAPSTPSGSDQGNASPNPRAILNLVESRLDSRPGHPPLSYTREEWVNQYVDPYATSIANAAATGVVTYLPSRRAGWEGWPRYRAALEWDEAQEEATAEAAQALLDAAEPPRRPGLRKRSGRSDTGN